jgi:anti-sigma factor RsiW
MNCRQLQESLGDHSVGLLDGATLSEFERHLSACAECAKSARQFRRCLELLNHVSSPAPPGDLWKGVHARLEVDRSARAQAHLSRRFQPRWPRHSSLMATAAGFAAAAVAMIGLSAQNPPTGGMASDTPPPALRVLDRGVFNPLAPAGATGAGMLVAPAENSRPFMLAPEPYILLQGPETLDWRMQQPSRHALDLGLIPPGALFGERPHAPDLSPDANPSNADNGQRP